MNATTPRRMASVLSSELALSRVAICSAPPSRRMPDSNAVSAGRCSTSSRIWLPSTVTVVKYAGAKPFATRRTWPVTGRPPPRDDGAAGGGHLPERGGGGADLLPGHDPLRRRGERVVGRLEQRVAGDQEGGQRRGQHGDDDGRRRRQHEAGAEGHASRST